MSAKDYQICPTLFKACTVKISKTGKILIGYTDNDVLPDFMSTTVEFVEIDKENTCEVKLKELL